MDTPYARLPPIPHNRAMDKDFPAALIPVAVVFFGMDLVSGFPLLTVVSSFLSQNGF